jgi:hypothetical protein
MLIPYFCTASRDGKVRPDYETIVRSFARKLAWNPNFTVAQPAKTLFSTSNHGTNEELPVTKWETLLKNLIAGLPKQSVAIFFVDALDECISENDYGQLLKYMGEIMQESPNVRLLCSSREHVPVPRLLGRVPQSDVKVLAESTKIDVEALIKGEIARRRPKCYMEGESVFCTFLLGPFVAICRLTRTDNPKKRSLLARLEDSLISNANGM